MTDDILKRSRRVSLTVAEITFLEQLLSKEVFDPGSMGTSLFGRFQRIIAEENDDDQQALYNAYRDAVELEDGEVEMDPNAEVSFGDDPGAYVLVWQWVSNAQAGLTTEITCMSCGDATNSDDSPDGEHCPDCYQREVDHP